MTIITPADALNFFQVRGYSPEQSAGIVANLVYESGWNPNAVGDSGLAFGLGQWHPDRQADYTAIMGGSIQGSTIEQQLSFVDWELRNRSYFGRDALLGSTTAAGAAGTFMQNFERPANLSSLDERQGIANKLLSGAKDLLNSSLGQRAINSGISAATGALDHILPGAGTAVGIGADALGIGSDCGLLCQFKEWLKSTGFFQRLALAVFAFIILLAGFYLMKPAALEAVTKRMKGN